MPWFKVDDGFHGHPKVIGLPASAVGLWLLAGTWAAQYLTDGNVPSGMVARFGGTPADADALVDAGLWDGTDDGFRFHEWEDYQPTKAQVEAERVAARERMQAVRAKRKGTAPNPVDSSPDVQPNSDGHSGEVRSTPAQPSPARPEPSKEVSGGTRKRARPRGQRIPEPFIVTRQMRDWAAGEVPTVDVDAATRVFVDHWRAESGQKATKRDWVATWRNWLRRDAEGPHRRTPKTFGQQKQDNTLALIERYRQEEAGHGTVADGRDAGLRALDAGR